MTDKVLSDLRRIATTYPTVGVQDAIIAAITEIERTRADLAAARALLRRQHETCAYGDPQVFGAVESYLAALSEGKK